MHSWLRTPPLPGSTQVRTADRIAAAEGPGFMDLAECDLNHIALL